MPYKDRTWNEIRDGKPLREWRRINKIYGKRHHLRNLLKKDAAALLERIHNVRAIQTPGPADALSDKVHKALRLPYAWNQEDYDHAHSLLMEVERQLGEYELCRIPRNGDLANTLIMFIRLAEEQDGEKGAAIVQCLHYMADNISLTAVADLENTETNYLANIIRSADGYYPEWFPKRLLQTVIKKLKQQDYLWLRDRITEQERRLKDGAFISSMFQVDKKDLDNVDI